MLGQEGVPGATNDVAAVHHGTNNGGIGLGLGGDDGSENSISELLDAGCIPVAGASALVAGEGLRDGNPIDEGRVPLTRPLVVGEVAVEKYGESELPRCEIAREDAAPAVEHRRKGRIAAEERVDTGVLLWLAFAEVDAAIIIIVIIVVAIIIIITIVIITSSARSADARVTRVFVVGFLEVGEEIAVGLLQLLDGKERGLEVAVEAGTIVIKIVSARAEIVRVTEIIVALIARALEIALGTVELIA